MLGSTLTMSFETLFFLWYEECGFYGNNMPRVRYISDPLPRNRMLLDHFNDSPFDEQVEQTWHMDKLRSSPQLPALQRGCVLIFENADSTL